MMKKLKTFGTDFKYAFHVATHPADGFWDLKHEKRGRTYIAVLLLVLYVLTDILDKQFNGYTFNTFAVFPQDIDIIGTFTSVFLIVAIWVMANWGFTTLFDGEGSMKDILIYTGYSMLPVVISQTLLLLLTNILTTNLGSYIPSPFSKSEIADVGSHIFFASCSCVNFFSFLACCT